MVTFSVRRKLNNDNFKIIIGSNDKKNPIIYYYSVKFYIIPQFDDNIKETINNIEKKFKKIIQDSTRNLDYISGTCIVNFDIAKERLVYNKRSQYCIECFCKQNENNVKDIELLDNKWFFECLDKLYEICSDKEIKIEKN